VGLTAPEIAAALGPPDFLRRDPPAEIWQYRASACFLDVFLYAEPGGLRAAYAEARPRNGLSTGLDTCFGSIAGRQAPIRSTGL
jgi:hypothetical protein